MGDLSAVPRPGIRVLVCGGRDYRDRPGVFDALNRAHAKRAICLVIHGAASGADSLGSAWARNRGIEEVPFPADWTQGRAAGPIRNQRMLDDGKPDAVIAFPGGQGTADMVRRAEAAGVPVWRPYG